MFEKDEYIKAEHNEQENQKNELTMPEFEKPDELCVRTYQGDRPAVSKDNTPIITTGCNLCSALVMRQGEVSVLFHVENSGLTVRQREDLKNLPKGSYVGKKIGNELSNIANDVIVMLKKEGGIIVDAENVEIKTDGGRYDVLYKPDGNKIFVRIRDGGRKPKIIEIEGLLLKQGNQKNN